MKIKFRLFYAIIATLLLFGIFTACTSQEKINPQNTQPGTPKQGQNINDIEYRGDLFGENMYLNQQDQQLTQMQKSDNKKVTDEIVRQLTEMNEINRVSAVVSGNTAIIGYIPSDASTDTNATKDAIIKKVKQIVPSISTVAVCESVNLMDKLTQLSKDLQNDRPVNEVGSEMSNLIQKINPIIR